MDKIKAANRVRSEHGAVAVELALILPILLLVVGGAVEFGRAFWFYDTLSKATRDAARYVSMVNCYPKETATDCQTRQGNVVNKATTMVTTAATESHLTNFGSGNVSVRCDGSPCVSNNLTDPAAAKPVYVSVSIVNNYGIRLGEWLPLAYFGSSPGYNLGIQPYTIMRYMGG